MYVAGGQYAAWAAFLERWAAGESLDPATLPVLDQGDFHAETWERLCRRILDALDQRQQAWTDTLSRELRGCTDEFVATRALSHARWSLRPIRELAGTRALPEDLRAQLAEVVDAKIRDIQRQLEEQVERMRRGGLPRSAVEARLRTIRDNPLSAVIERANSHLTGDAWAADPLASARRRVIVDMSQPAAENPGKFVT